MSRQTQSKPAMPISSAANGEGITHQPPSEAPPRSQTSRSLIGVPAKSQILWGKAGSRHRHLAAADAVDDAERLLAVEDAQQVGPHHLQHPRPGLLGGPAGVR